MPAQRTLALVLRSTEVFETSLVTTLFTRELGKVSALAKGARRPKSAFQGGLDLMGLSDIVVFPKASESLDLLAEAAPVERFACLRRDLAAWNTGFYVAELLSDLTGPHDPHPKLFDAARVTLRHLGEPELRSRRVLRFEMACLRELGLAPALDACAHCGASIEGKEGPVGFGPDLGGVLCDECRIGRSPVVELSPRALNVIRALGRPGDDWRATGPEIAAGLGPAIDTIGATLNHVLGRRPRLRPFPGA